MTLPRMFGGIAQGDVSIARIVMGQAIQAMSSMSFMEWQLRACYLRWVEGQSFQTIAIMVGRSRPRVQQVVYRCERHLDEPIFRRLVSRGFRAGIEASYATEVRAFRLRTTDALAPTEGAHA